MGYSNSKRAVARVKNYLDKMIQAEGLIEFTSEDASKSAYYIREGIQVSKRFAVDHKTNAPIEPYASYQTLAAKYIIRVKGNRIVCEPRDAVANVVVERPIMSVTLSEISDTLGIIGAAILHSAPCMVFPDANDISIDEDRLRVWCTAHGYDLIVADNHVTITRTREHEYSEKGSSSI